jgi:prepilin-type N-terminal cleavage/methylation domain-containing protein
VELLGRLSFLEFNIIRTKKAFTLIELLVVIAIIALLLSILTPSLNAVKERAKSTVCQAHLHSWALSLAIYAQNFEDKICPALAVVERDSSGNPTKYYQWDTLLLRYYDGSEDIRLCPKAAKPDPAETGAEKVGSEQYCWYVDYTTHTSEGEGIKYGSYGFNGWAQYPTEDVQREWGQPQELHWGKVTIKGQLNRIPLFLDSLWKEAYPAPFNVTSGAGLPMETQEDTTWEIQGEFEINRFCLDRHNKTVDVAFLDTSVRNVDLPELWNLKWSREFIPQTEEEMIADGYECFPKWMKK